jgi:hypothetical protein
MIMIMLITIYIYYYYVYAGNTSMILRNRLTNQYPFAVRLLAVGVAKLFAISSLHFMVYVFIVDIQDQHL